jgi:hypothetical protein
MFLRLNSAVLLLRIDWQRNAHESRPAKELGQLEHAAKLLGGEANGFRCRCRPALINPRGHTTFSDLRQRCVTGRISVLCPR